MLCQYLAMSCDPVIVIHGGAWAVPDHLAEASRRGVREAARAGHRVLASGGSAVEAVTAADVAAVRRFKESHALRLRIVYNITYLVLCADLCFQTIPAGVYDASSIKCETNQ